MKVVDLFCGAGGFSEGFRQAGFDIVFAVDNNKKACKTFKYNFPEADVFCEDVRKVQHLPKCDVVIGSPPCKEFSKGNVTRQFDYSLIEPFLDLVFKTKPTYWVMENVPDIATLSFFEKYRKRFRTMQVLNAYHFGAATWRTRFFGGRFPKVYQVPIAKWNAVRDVININRCGYRQPFKEKVYRKIDPKKPLFTLCSQRIGNERYLLPNGTSLTVTEMAICQGFPPNFVFPCSRSEMQRQLGMSVCPPVAKAIAEAIKE